MDAGARASAVPAPHVLVTRPEAQAADWVAQLGRHGIEATALPLIAIETVADPTAAAAAWDALADYRLVMFVSPNAATRFFALRPGQGAGPHAWPADVEVASPGPGTSAGLVALGVPAAQIVEPVADAAQFDSEALWQQLQGRDWRGVAVLVVCGEGGRDWLARQLQDRGARVHRLVAYRRAPPAWPPHRQALVAQALARPQDHLWFFSSSQAVDHLLTRHPAPAWALSQALATHPRIAQTAREAGFGRVLVSRPTLDAVVACIQSSPNPSSP